MRISLIATDQMMIVDGEARAIDLRGLDPGIHAIQWFDDHGDIEWRRPSQRNESITEFKSFQFLLDAWKAAEPPSPEPVTIPTKDDLLDRTLSDPTLKAIIVELAARQGLNETQLRTAVKGRLP